jgi:hypothetical protein
MLVVTAALSTSAVAQQRGAAWMIGLSATLGSGWQMENADIGFTRPIAFGPLRHASISARLGAFQDEGGFLFGARGFVGGVALGTQTRPYQIFQVGSEDNPVGIGLDVTLEGAGYLASDSPFPQGDAWVSFAVLPGVRSIQTDSFGASIMVGPAVFIGQETTVRTFLAFHLEVPVGRAPPAGP